MPAIGVHHTATSDGSWDGPAAKANLKNDGSESYYRSAFAWAPAEGKDVKSNYKFIHHEVSSDGKVGAANLTACSTGIGVLNGGRGGTVIPAGDKKGVYSHLAAHLKDAGKEAPEYKGDSEEENESPEERRQELQDGEEPGEKKSAMPVRIIRAMCATPWAILPEKLEALFEVVGLHAAGVKPTRDYVSYIKAATKMQLRSSNGGQVAVLPMFGTISQRMSPINDASGSTSTDAFRAMFDMAMRDPQCSAVVIDTDSPGGTIYGVDELSNYIRSMRGKKPIVAACNSMMASAAYWICSAADEIACTPTGECGSIGVFAAHADYSQADRASGVKVTLVSAGKYKVEGNEYEPLDDAARQAMQDRVDEYYDMFTAAVAKNRGVSQDDVKNGFGQGRVLGARAAKKAGLIDKVETLDQTIARLGIPMNTATKIPMQMGASIAMTRREARARRFGIEL